MGTSSRRATGRTSRRGRVAAIGALLSLAFPIVAAHSSLAVTAAASREARPASLELFAGSPVLVRAGEPVEIPVDAACSTSRGTSCPATVTLRIRRADGSWAVSNAPASSGLRFDVSRLAREASTSHPLGGAAVAYRIAARSGDRSASLPASGAALHFYTVPELPAVAVAAAPFGQVETGDVVLYLPWGSGPDRAGLSPGLESSTMGPSSFDVDANGDIVLVDGLQRRLARFEGGALVGQVEVNAGPRGDVAVADDGGAFVSSTPAEDLPLITVTHVDAQGEAGTPFAVGAIGNIPSELRTAGNEAYLDALPLDAWIPASPSAASGSFTGRPLDDGSQLLRVAEDDAVRLATLVDGQATDAVELLFQQHVGEIALAEPDGSGGYFAVVHLWQELPTAADQYQVIHVDAQHAVRSFAVTRQDFAEASPMSTFRLGGDGALYQLTSSSDGMRIVRYDLGGIR
jgi:hypothetical protein